MKYCGNKVCFWYYQHKVKKGGGAASQFKLGQLYENGDGVQKDLKQAFNLYKKAAEGEFAEAQCRVGVCYAKGIGVETNWVDAVRWYGMAAEKIMLRRRIV